MSISTSMLSRQSNGYLRPIILTGQAGVGKTELASKLLPDAIVVRIPMATRSFETFGTYPYPVQGQNGMVEIQNPVCETAITPLFDENIGEDAGLLVFDDVTLADERLQSSILDIVQFHKLGNHSLGKNVLIVLTGNGVDHGAFAVDWSKPLLGRCMVIEQKPTLDGWLNSKSNMSCDPSVIAFLKEHPDLLAPLPSADNNDNYIDEIGRMPSPRDWTELGVAINSWGGWSKFEPNPLFQSPEDFVTAYVGSLAASSLSVFMETFGLYPSIHDLLDSPTLWEELPIGLRASHSAAISITYSLIANLKMMEEEKKKGSIGAAFNNTMAVLETIVKDHKEVLAYFCDHIINLSQKEFPGLVKAMQQCVLSGNLMKNEEVQRLYATRRQLKSAA